ncbi:MAG: hypothetical protein Q7T91_07365 [Sulfuricurvum sp.]|nr:hypothetical protein [Sulfuricurvum sp.]MDP3302321.1 hypothetical protein [Sulfuricurvum sp.]
MNTVQNNGVEGRRGFLKKSVYMAPALMMLGSLNSYAHSNGDSKSHTNSKGPGNSSLKGNNGYGNGDQCAPGNSLNHNGAENDTDGKKKVNNVGVETHGGHEKDIADDKHNDHDKHDKTSSKAPSFKFKNS